MNLSVLKPGSLMLFLLLTAVSVFSQDVPGDRVSFAYLKKVKVEGYELVKHGSFNKGELPQSITLELEAYHKYQIFAIPSGKLKALTVSIGYLTLSSTKANPVFDWVHVSHKSEKTKFKFMNKKKKGKFKLSPEDSVYYIIAKKPV